MTTTADEPRSIEDREARVAEIDGRLAELDAEYAGELMPDEVRQEWNELNAERDAHATAIRELKARRERLRALAGNPANGERATGEVPAFVQRRGVEIYDLTRIRAESRDEDEYRARLHDNARRAIERAAFPAKAGTRERVAERVEDLLARVDDRHGTLAKRILATGNPVYDRAFGKMLLSGAHTLTGEEMRAMSVGGGSPVGSEGGFAVPFFLDPTVILTSDGSLSPLRQISRVEQITTKTWQGVTSQGITVSRSAEGAEAGDNSFTIDQPEVTPTRVVANVEFSAEIDQDWSQLRSEISRLLADAKAREEDAAFVTGDGTGNNPSGVVATLAATSEVAETTPGTFDSEQLFRVEEALPPRFRARGRWLAQKTIYNDVRAFGAASDGGDLWVRLGAGQPSELLGYPAHEASEMDGRGPGNRYLLFGDFSEFLIVDRIGMMVEVQPHVLGSTNRRWTGQRAIVALWRNSSLVLADNAFRVLVDGTT